MLAFAVAAAVAASPVTLDPAVAEITRLEERWGEAFVKRDFNFIERIVAPEYRLVGASPDGSFGPAYGIDQSQGPLSPHLQ